MRQSLLNALCMGLLAWSVLPAEAAFADASPIEEAYGVLDNARDAFVYGDYAVTIDILEEPMLRGSLSLDTDAMTEAWTLLAVSAHLVGDLDLSERAFLGLLRLDPRHQLDPLLYPPAVRMFLQEVRRQHAESLPAGDSSSEPPPVIYIESRVETQTLLVSMLPFGYGFFSGGNDVLGFLYLVSQASVGLTSATLYVLNEASRDRRGFFPDPERARRRQEAQIVTGWTFIGLVVVNAVHGSLAHPGFSTVEFRGLDEAPSAMRPGRPRIAPGLAHTPAGLTLTLPIR